MLAGAEIIDFSPAFRADFRSLNHEWITQYFELEELDNQILDDPENTILAPGGHIFMARYQQEIVGTCALIKDRKRFGNWEKWPWLKRCGA